MIQHKNIECLTYIMPPRNADRNVCCILYDCNSPFRFFADVNEGLMFLKMMSLARHKFLTVSSVHQCDLGLYLDVIRFDQYGLFTNQNKFKFDTDTSKYIDALTELRVAQKINLIEQITEEQELDKKINELQTTGDESLELQLGKDIQENNEQLNSDKKQQAIEAKKKENLSVFMSNKDTYLKIRNKIVNGILKRDSVPLLFADKYPIYEFMENRGLISFTSNFCSETEHELYCQLHKIIESNDYVNDNTLYKDDPINTVLQEYSNICDEFLTYLETNGGVPASERTVHLKLNMEHAYPMFDRDEEINEA